MFAFTPAQLHEATQLLGLPIDGMRQRRFDQKAVQGIYRILISKYHPDTAGNTPENERISRQLNNAFDIVQEWIASGIPWPELQQDAEPEPEPPPKPQERPYQPPDPPRYEPEPVPPWVYQPLSRRTIVLGRAAVIGGAAILAVIYFVAGAPLPFEPPSWWLKSNGSFRYIPRDNGRNVVLDYGLVREDFVPDMHAALRAHPFQRGQQTMSLHMPRKTAPGALVTIRLEKRPPHTDVFIRCQYLNDQEGQSGVLEMPPTYDSDCPAWLRGRPPIPQTGTAGDAARAARMRQFETQAPRPD